MSTGHLHSHPIDAKRERELATLLDQPWFQQAVSAYQTEDDTHNIPFAGGSDNAGKKIFWDRRLSAYIKAGRFRIAGKSVDPRPVGGKTHEAVEGAILRNWDRVCQLLGWPKSEPRYDTAHDIATIAERHTVEHVGWNWNEYQNAWREALPAIENEKVTNPPPDLLKIPYQGTPQAKEMGGYAPSSNDSTAKVMPVGLSQNPSGISFQCGHCEFINNGHCQNPHPDLNGRKVDLKWCCNLFNRTGMKVIVR